MLNKPKHLDQDRFGKGKQKLENPAPLKAESQQNK